MTAHLTWVEPVEIDIAPEFRDTVGGHPIVAERLAAIGLDTVAGAMGFIHPEQYHPAPVEELPGVDRATQRLIQAHKKLEKVCVWGDFDVDGQTSTALLVDVLRRC
ncbi:MAG: hypothetical protein PVG04_09595, partial [Anaerolineales bacterium]